MLAVVTALGVAGCSGVQARERGDSLLLGTAMRTAIFITGAAGDIKPREPLFAEPEKARPMGEALAAEVLASGPVRGEPDCKS